MALLIKYNCPKARETTFWERGTAVKSALQFLQALFFNDE
jgi:hypothetical protein